MVSFFLLHHCHCVYVFICNTVKIICYCLHSAMGSSWCYLFICLLIYFVIMWITKAFVSQSSTKRYAWNSGKLFVFKAFQMILMFPCLQNTSSAHQFWNQIALKLISAFHQVGDWYKLLFLSELATPKDCFKDEKKNLDQVSVAVLVQCRYSNDSCIHSFIYWISKSQLHCHSATQYSFLVVQSS